MNILAVDTSTLVLSVAVLNEQKVLGEKNTNLKKNHSVRLMPAIDELLTDLDMTLNDIDLFAVTAGPGSYTGVRIGVTTIKTFAWASKRPFVAISTLETMAMNGCYFTGNIVPLLDARRGNVYAAVYQRIDKQLSVTFDEQILPLTELLHHLTQINLPTLFIGDDTAFFSDQITAELGEKASFAPVSFQLPRASHTGLLALERWQQTQKGEHQAFSPNYLQLTLAEKNILRKQS
jgi:tRNA threonylcarbamoyladenosine biosynthesis protein TsaB